MPATSLAAGVTTARPRTLPTERLPPALRQVVRYAVVGGASTALNAVLFYLLRAWWDPAPAAALSLVLSTAYSTEAHRRYTFGAPVVHRWRLHLQSLGTIAFYAWYSAVVLALLHVVVAEPTRLQETLSIATTSLLGGMGRFLLLRSWVFAPTAPIASAITVPEVAAAPAP
ncbi:GtrA family protein [Pseudonocardia sp.]|uniref:GtrA family protein n=1 Tax=Pseudonocardia sp. TaxID=60912 RepID=UPI003D0E3853